MRFLGAVGLVVGLCAAQACGADEPRDDAVGAAGADDGGAAGSPTADGGVRSVPEDWWTAGEADGGALVSTPSEPPRIGLNQVSILFPEFPPNSDPQHVGLTFMSEGARGALFPRELYDRHVGQLWDFEESAPDNGYQWAIVSSIRLDPCPDATGAEQPTSCRPELRLNLHPAEGGEVSILSPAAVQLAYTLTEDELITLLEAIRELDPEPEVSRYRALGPHPALLKQGPEGAFAVGLKKLILSHAGASNLIGFRTIQLKGVTASGFTAMVFRQFDKVGDGFEAAEIPGLGETEQTFQEQATDARRSRDTVVSGLNGPLGFPRALLSSTEARRLTESEAKSALTTLARLEDPRAVSALQVDCVSCHIAGNARPFYEGLLGVRAPSSFEAPGYNLERLDENGLSGGSVSQLGNVEGSISISPRAINETARAAAWLEQKLP